MSKREYRNMSLKELVEYAADELSDCSGRCFQNHLFTKARHKDMEDIAAILREKVAA